jgi:hypothetical protein
MTNADSKTEIIDAILKNREIIKSRIHLKQFKEHLTKEEIKKLHKPITDKLDNITEFASLMMNEANPKNVLAIEEEGLPRVHQRVRSTQVKDGSRGDLKIPESKTKTKMFQRMQKAMM